jgi:ATP-dependent RNA helicase DOB1
VPKDRSGNTPTPAGIQPCPMGQRGSPVLVPVLLATIDSISHLRMVVPKDLRQDRARETLWKAVLEVHRRVPDGILNLDPIQNMGIKDEKFTSLVQVCYPFDSKTS